VPILTPIPAQLFVASILAASVLLAGWMLLRFERIGPHTLTGGFLAFVAAMMLVSALPSFIEEVIGTGVPEPRVIVVFGLALPTFTYLFLAGGWFMRSILRLSGGHFG
jgi:hypothetical protein